ncbi:DUF397 domain-containing protein [Actinocorallia longicatena]|uniref:DUF397 domain-containing protein n=1 Tax=Actinocorallia longicatena TaxID=111803 RepID=A0ABP6Q3N3_9ACTN
MTNWRKSSYSGTSDDGVTCVEVAELSQGVGVRDSKNPELGHLDLSLRVWRGLTEGLR